MSSSLCDEVALFDDEATSMLACQIVLLSCACWLFFPNPRGPSFFEQRLCWENCCDKHSGHRTLKIRIRMDLDSFNESLACVCTDLVVNEVMTGHRGGPTLGWLAGGLHLETSDIAGISTSSFHRVIWKTVAAMIRCTQLIMHFPSPNRKIELAIQGFESTSLEKHLRTVILWLMTIQCAS